MNTNIFKLTIVDGGFVQHVEWPVLRSSGAELESPCSRGGLKRGW